MAFERFRKLFSRPEKPEEPKKDEMELPPAPEQGRKNQSFGVGEMVELDGQEALGTIEGVNSSDKIVIKFTDGTTEELDPDVFDSRNPKKISPNEADRRSLKHLEGKQVKAVNRMNGKEVEGVLTWQENCWGVQAEGKAYQVDPKTVQEPGVDLR